MPHTILVGAYSDVITTLSFDPDASPKPTLKVVGTSPAGSNPSWIGTHPTDASLLFAINECPEGKLMMFKINEADGLLSHVGTAWSGGADAAHFHVGEREVVVANYSSGTLFTVPISLSPPALLAPLSPPVTLDFPGTGPKAKRQEGSHPHQVYAHPSGKELLIPDLGSDKILRLVRDDDSRSWKVKEAIQSRAGSGPRHLVVKGESMYVVDELDSTVTVYSYPSESEVKTVKTVSSLTPPTEAAEGMLGAEILLSKASSPAFPEPLIYVSNRNDPHAEGDSVAVFTTEDSAEGFGLVAEIRTGMKHLRALTLGGKDDRYVVAGGASGGGIKVFERVEKGRGLKELVHLEEGVVASPTCFVML